MSILQENIDTGLELRFAETFDASEFRGASDCNESIAVAKFYNLVGYSQRDISRNPVDCLEHKFHKLTDMDWAMNYTNVEKWVDICRAIIRIRPGKSRIAICKRTNSNLYGRDRGPMIYVRVERQGMRKRNHWYATFEFKIALKEENLGPYIFKNLNVSDSYWTFINIDENGTIIRVS